MKWTTLPSSGRRVLFDEGVPLLLWLPAGANDLSADLGLRMARGWAVRCADLADDERGRLRLVLVASQLGESAQMVGPDKALRALAFASLAAS